MLSRATSSLLGGLVGPAKSLGALSQALENQTRSLITSVITPGDGLPRTVTLLPGDGIGPEVAKAVVDVVAELRAPIVWERLNISGTLQNGQPRTEVPKELLESIRRNGVCLKGTLLTAVDKKYTQNQSINLQLRKDLDLWVNLVHGFTMPGVKSRYDHIDIVVIRENVEGEYSGLEHEVVDGVVESLKVVTYEKSIRTAQYAFEFALLNNRKKVTAVHKANIMKQSDGMFLKAVRDVAAQFPTIKYDEIIVDNTCMQLVSKPEQFDVLVTPNLYGNIVANIIAGLCGGYGISPGANIGQHTAVFEQGARQMANSLSGKGLSNPTATLFATCMMLRHLKMHNHADRLEQSVLKVYKQGNMDVLTQDVGGNGTLHTFSNAVMKGL